MSRNLKIVLFTLTIGLALETQGQSCDALPPSALCIDPLSWNIIGLDSNKATPPTSDGPDTFMVGARACNTTATTMTNVVATYNTVGAVNPYITLADNSTITIPELKPGRCEDFYFNGRITRTNAAYFTSQGYTITVTANGGLTAVTPANRALYIEKLNSQNRNQVLSVTGPTSLQVGGIYTFRVDWSTAPGGYEQLEHFVNLANTSFRLLSSYSTYDTPAGTTNTSIYADGCGWDNDILSPTYRSCIGPENYPAGKTGGNLVTYFTVQILGATPTAGERLRALIYDFSGSSYHYNTDYNDPNGGLVVTAAAAADLGVTISDAPDPVGVGGTITYTGTVSNAGLSPVLVTDNGSLKIPIPPGTTYSSMTMPGWSCSLVSGVATCTPLAAFGSGASASYTLAVTVNPATAAGSIIQATASISSNHEDGNPTNNVASTTTVVVSPTQTDLVVTNTVPAVVVRTQPYTFTQTVTNNGPAAATAPTFVTQVPSSSIFSSITTPSAGWTCSAPVGGTITCTRSTPLAVGESAVFSLNMIASGAIGSTPTSLAYAHTSTSEPFVANNSATAATRIIAANTADVGIVVSDSPDPVVPGESIRYTQTVTNWGVVPAQNVTVSFPTPPNTVYSYVDYPAGWTCSTYPLPGSPAPGSSGTITCTIPTLGVGETASFPLTVSVASATPIGTIINYTATVSTTTADSIASNNTSSASTLVGSPTAADVEIVKTPSANPSRVADRLTYNLRVTNHGPATATNVTVSDPLPAGLTFDGVTTSRGTCSYNAGTRTIACNVGTLTNGQVAAITVRTIVDGSASGLTINNTATVSASQSDPRMANNTSSAPVSIVSATAVSMLEMDAVARGKVVQLLWSTSWERDNLGFNVYRESGSQRARLNKALIAGSTLIAGAEVPAGFSYRWMDRKPVTGAVYWIESVDLDGTTELHGPIVPRGETGAAAAASAAVESNSVTLGDLSSRTARTKTAPQEVTIDAVESHGAPDLARARQFDIAAQPAARIRVSREGIVRVTRAQLAAAGFDPGSDAKVLSLYNDATEVPLAIGDGGDGRWDAGDHFEFYAYGLDTTYSGTRTYWLLAGHNGLRFKPKSRVKGAAAAGSSFTHTVELKERFIFFSAMANAPDRDSFYGPVLYYDPAVQTFAISNVAADGGPAVIKVVAQGATLQQHRIAVTLNGAALGTLEFFGQASGEATFTIPAASLRQGTNELRLTAKAGANDISFLDYVRITYPHTYAADGDVLRFPVTGTTERTVTGFSSGDIRVVDVTDPRDPREVESRVTANGGTYAVSVIPFDKGERVLYATTTRVLDAPQSITANAPSTLGDRHNSADFVILTSAAFRDELTPLADKRNGEGVQTLVVDVEDVYDEFGYGAKSPDAIREFLKYAQTEWRRGPRYAMLVGDASFDPRNYIGYGDFDHVPTRFVPTAWMKAASDDALADFDGDGDADIAIGRLPVRTVAEARTVVEKIVGYAPDAAPRTLMVVDKDDKSFSFRAAATRVAAAVPQDIAVQRFEINSSKDRTALVSAMNSRPLIVNYVGHGSIEGWSNTGVLSSAQSAAMRGSGSTPFVVAMACLNAYFAEPDVTSLGEALLHVPDGGAVAVWASSGMADAPAQEDVNAALYRILAADPAIRLGDLVLRAKAATTDQAVRATWNLLGDPTLRLR